MKDLYAALCNIVLVGFSATALADTSWLLLEHNGPADSIAITAEGGALHPIASPGRVLDYGELGHELGFLSYDIAQTEFVLSIVDESSRQVTLTRFVRLDGNHPVQWMSGAVRDLALTDQAAYFVSYLLTEGDVKERNSAGGLYNFNRVRLADGKITQWPLPDDCVNPHVVDFEGVPLIYSWEGFGVWKFDATKGSLVQLVGTKDVTDIETREGNAKYKRTPETGILSDYVMVPGAGAFRLSRICELQQVLNADLTLVGLPRRTLKVAGAGERPQILLGNFHGTPAIGVARVLSDHLDFEYIDPLSFKTEWEVTLPGSAFIPTFYGMSGDGLIYFDRETASINKVSQQGTTILQKVSAEAARDEVKVLSMSTR